MKLTTKQLIKTVTLNENIDKAWWRWTTHEGLLTFFGRDNKIELMPGGAFEIYFIMDAPIGLRGSEGCKILSYLPKQMLSFSWNAPPQFKEVRESNYYTWVVVTFDVISETKTKVEINHLGWPEDKRWDPVYDYFDNAWNSVVKWLEEAK